MKIGLVLERAVNGFDNNFQIYAFLWQMFQQPNICLQINKTQLLFDMCKYKNLKIILKQNFSTLSSHRRIQNYCAKIYKRLVYLYMCNYKRVYIYIYIYICNTNLALFYISLRLRSLWTLTIFLAHCMSKKDRMTFSAVSVQSERSLSV